MPPRLVQRWKAGLPESPVSNWTAERLVVIWWEFPETETLLLLAGAIRVLRAPSGPRP